MKLEIGSKVTWSHTPRGGYGFKTLVAAVVVSLGPKRVQVRVAFRDPLTRSWATRLRWVEPVHLAARTEYVREVDG